MDGPSSTNLRKPHFETMMQLEPDSRYNVKVKVVSYETLSVRKRIDGNIVEVGQALVGDTYACAHLILRGDQVKNFSSPGTSLILRNAHTRVDRTGHIKLNVDIWGKIELDEKGIGGEVNLKNNISDAEYEAVYNEPKPRGGYGGGRGGGDYHRGGRGGGEYRGGRYN